MAWRILLALTLARMCMALQFQAVPALGEPRVASGDLSYAALGTLTGAYFLPGVFVALAGGWLGQKVGDARVLLTSLGLMSFGGLMGWWVAGFEAEVFWRLVAGIGAVCVNVFVTKMVADWFDGRDDLPLAMGVLVASWPAGLALAVMVLPALADWIGMAGASLFPVISCACALVLVLLTWRAPDGTAVRQLGEKSVWLTSRELLLVTLAGTIWSVYNLGFIGVITWTPGLLQSNGVDPVSAGAAASLIGWTAIISVAAGGWLAARARHRDTPSLVSLLGAACLFLVLPALGAQAGFAPVMIAVGAIIGPAAAMIMTLPVEASRPSVRALAMGIYFAIYYALMGLAPLGFGALRDATSSAVAPIYASAALMFLSAVLWVLFRCLQRVAIKL